MLLWEPAARQPDAGTELLVLEEKRASATAGEHRVGGRGGRGGGVFLVVQIELELSSQQTSTVAGLEA